MLSNIDRVERVRELYRPNSQDTARFGITPFQRVDILLDRDRTFGEFFPQLEGEGIYVEAADYPCLISLVQQGSPSRQISVAARDGQVIRTPFKGLSIAHPNLTPTGFQRFAISLLLLKSENSFTNELSGPRTRLPLSARQINNSALIQTIGIHVPQGVRQLDYLSVSMGATTVIDATMQGAWAAAVAIIAPSTIVQQDPATNAPIAYNMNPITLQQPAAQITILAGPPVQAYIFFNHPMVLPANTFEVQVTVTGTGLTVPDAINGAFS